MEAYEETWPLTVTFVSRGLGSSSSNKSYMVSHVEVPPYLLHVVSVNKWVISDFSDTTSFPFFSIAPKDPFCGFSLKMERNKNYQIYRDKKDNLKKVIRKEFYLNASEKISYHVGWIFTHKCHYPLLNSH